MSNGYSLLELSIVLIVLSILTTTSFSIGTSYINSKRQEVTIEKMKVIQKSLDNYVNLYKSLPCPASPTSVNTDSNFGVGAIMSGTSGSDTRCIATGMLENNDDVGLGIAKETIAKGAIPVRTLDLPDEMMFDGWGRRFSYILESKFADPSIFEDIGGQGILHIWKENDLSKAAATSNAISIIMSHGRSGYGAWNRNGTLTKSLADNTNAFRRGSNANHLVNSSFAPKFSQVALHYSDTTNKDATVYDDIVIYRMRWQYGDVVPQTISDHLARVYMDPTLYSIHNVTTYAWEDAVPDSSNLTANNGECFPTGGATDYSVYSTIIGDDHACTGDTGYLHPVCIYFCRVLDNSGNIHGGVVSAYTGCRCAYDNLSGGINYSENYQILRGGAMLNRVTGSSALEKAVSIGPNLLLCRSISHSVVYAGYNRAAAGRHIIGYYNIADDVCRVYDHVLGLFANSTTDEFYHVP